jgi:hypothetical protein
MPILPDSDQEDRLKVKAITGAEWNETLDYIKRITPRGDGDTTYAETTKDGTNIQAIDVPVADGGGASLEDMPGRATFDGESLITGREWNKLLDYLQMITPATDGETATGKSISDGVEISFPPIVEEEEPPVGCETGPFFWNVTVTGGTYPWTWQDSTWTASGQTLPICGSGTQADQTTSSPIPGYPYYNPGYQDWLADPYPSVFAATAKYSNYGYNNYFILQLKRITAPSPFYWRIYARGAKYLTLVSSGSTISSNVASGSPTWSTLFNPTTRTRLNNNFIGSITLTSGRVISWAPSPDFPWDYDNPPT